MGHSRYGRKLLVRGQAVGLFGRYGVHCGYPLGLVGCVVVFIHPGFVDAMDGDQGPIVRHDARETTIGIEA